MAQSIFKAALLSAVLATVTASPTPATHTFAKRWEEGKDCTADVVSDHPAGLFFAVDSEGINAYCDDINDDVSADNGYTCYQTSENDDVLGDMVKCPGDPAPKKNPDGSDAAEVAGGIIGAWCAAGGSLPTPLGEFASIVGCLQYGFYEAHGDPAKEAETGAKGVCNTIFAGACTWFFDVAPDISESMCDPCEDDPESIACTFGGPSK
ncbi:hypothetical protein GGS20DRAFT_286591 [Poronia punctata]|nr:hypothetical protein GGS20DRAFT_286591 [Poronia punctata]